VTFSVRKADLADADAILGCLGSAFAPYRERYSAEAYLDTVLEPKTMRERLARMTVFVAVDAGGCVVGTVAGALVNADEGHVRGMAVRPDWEGAGVATRLLASVESAMWARGCSRITLDTTAPLERAVRLYERNGFRRSGIVRDYFGMQLVEFVKQR
jgi:GNAT superfamily N-acetyltransferase